MSLVVEHEDHLDLDLDAVPLTEAQRAALAIDRHLVVSAGAGSGKTHTLAWRYVRLLLKLAQEGATTPEGVLVLTFTEKAAHEMAQRCERRLIELGHPAVAPLVDSFQRASIQTFHAFCARITREFPGWTGIPADARVLEPDEATRLRRELGAQAFDRWLETRTETVGLLLDTFGSRRGVLEAIDQALARHGVLRERLGQHARGELRDPGSVETRCAATLGPSSQLSTRSSSRSTFARAAGLHQVQAGSSAVSTTVSNGADVSPSASAWSACIFAVGRPWATASCTSCSEAPNHGLLHTPTHESGSPVTSACTRFAASRTSSRSQNPTPFATS